jgi:hypothetical protein
MRSRTGFGILEIAEGEPAAQQFRYISTILSLEVAFLKQESPCGGVNYPEVPSLR